MIIQPPVPTAGNATLNSAGAIFAGAYLLIAMYQGNLATLAAQVKADLLGDASHTGFWRWALALLLLIFVTHLGAVRPYSGAIVGIVLIAMLIEMETTQPGTFAKLTQSIATLFGRGQSSTGITGQ